ncbi:MAG TPA: hypothetical protein VFD71_10470 [Planctomycetota bacterium]|nr:hypothetical protein [Planctomycetota bacterium]
MLRTPAVVLTATLTCGSVARADGVPPFPQDPDQALERTCFQTGGAYSEVGNLRSDVAIVYGVDESLPERIRTWRERGYRIHVMTGVSWGRYQDYLYGRFDGVNHEDEAQTDRNGKKISHGGDVYYMCPGEGFGKFLAVGVQRALDAGAEAIHLEEPEFWARAGYSEGFRREWRSFYKEEWQPPHSSVDASWRAAKLKYFLYRRALQQVFDHVRAYNARTGRRVRCYVPTHSLINYAQWGIVSPESSLARLEGCDGYIAQVWTGTARTPNVFRGKLAERTFETAFLEYGAMQNLVRSTGRSIWLLNDPVEDNPNHSWSDYQAQWESTLVASLLQPDVAQYEVAPWPERVFGGRYPRRAPRSERASIPAAYATELQVVFHALNNQRQPRAAWDCGSAGVGVLVSDSLMFERGEPSPSDRHLGHFYGLALPLLARGLPVTPVQLENAVIPGFLDPFRVLLLTYRGMKPLTADVHAPLADWVRRGGVLVVCDDDGDPFAKVREWWNTDGNSFRSPREHLFERIGIVAGSEPGEEALAEVGKGGLVWLRKDPAALAASPTGDAVVVETVKRAAARAGLLWRESSRLVLRRGPYVVAAGLDGTVADGKDFLEGRFVSLFDPELRIVRRASTAPGSRAFLLDLDAAGLSSREPRVLAAACKTLVLDAAADRLSIAVEGVASTQAIVLLQVASPPRAVKLAGQSVESIEHSAAEKLCWIRFANTAAPREMEVRF